MATCPIMRCIGIWLVTACRILVGLLVLKTGINLMQGATFTGYDRQDALITGGFVMIIGLYIIFSSMYRISRRKGR